MPTAERFRTARWNLNLTISECADLLHVSPSTVKRYERTKPKPLPLQYLELRCGDFRHLGRAWRNFWIDQDGNITDGRHSWPPSAYYAIAHLNNAVDAYQHRIEQMKRGYQVDLFDQVKTPGVFENLAR